MLDLTTLLQQRDETPVVQPPAADPLAAHEIALTLRLQPAANFTQRTVQGVIGIPKQMPIFLSEGVTLTELIATVQALYAQLTPPMEAAATQTECSSRHPRGSAEIASVTTAPASQLDIF